MNRISTLMIGLLERLSEMFPNSNYQSKLDSYLKDKGITDAAQLEYYIQRFNYER